MIRAKGLKSLDDGLRKIPILILEVAKVKKEYYIINEGKASTSEEVELSMEEAIDIDIM